MLVLQGGGALGSYQAGAYQALSHHDFEPEWVAGISIGAINAAIIAGNDPARRVARLKEFWEQSSSPVPWNPLVKGERGRTVFNEASAALIATFGVPGFFAVQTLHAASAALTIIGLQKMIALTVPEERTGAAQGIAYFANGFCMAAVTLVSGPLYDRFGVRGFFFMIAVALAGLALIWLASRSAPERALRR